MTNNVVGVGLRGQAALSQRRRMAAAKQFMVEELRWEREASSLNISELTTFVDGGEMLSEKRRETCKLATKR